MAQPQQQQPMLRLRFARGPLLSVDPADAAAVLRGHAVLAPITRRVFDMLTVYVGKHAAHRRGVDTDPDIVGWDRSFIDRVHDTDTLHGLLLASERLAEDGLVNLCAAKTADMIKGRTVEDVKTRLGIAGVTPEQDRQAQRDHLLRIIP